MRESKRIIFSTLFCLVGVCRTIKQTRGSCSFASLFRREIICCFGADILIVSLKVHITSDLFERTACGHFIYFRQIDTQCSEILVVKSFKIKDILDSNGISIKKIDNL